MAILNLTAADWPSFAALAAAEGWSIPLQEQRLFQNHWRPFFFVLKEQGTPFGFVSAVAYKSSGWIGNLLIAPEQRGKGYGAELFDFALDFLRRSRPQRIWLTASTQGAPLYRKRGFVSVDRIDRWSGSGLAATTEDSGRELSDLIDCDTRCWGESRAPLLKLLCDDSLPLTAGEDRALLQPGLEFWQLGPWLSPRQNPRDNRQLLQQARERTPQGKTLVADILISSGQELNLRNAGYQRGGSNELMCLAADPQTPGGVVALASLGSIG